MSWQLYVSSGLNIIVLGPSFFMVPIATMYLLKKKPAMGEALVNIFEQIGWITGVPKMKWICIFLVQWIAIIMLAGFTWVRTSWAQAMVNSAMLWQLFFAVVTGYNKLSALKIKPGCGAHHSYFFDTVLFLNLIFRFIFWQECGLSYEGLWFMLFLGGALIVIGGILILSMKKRKAVTESALKYEKQWTDEFDKLMEKEEKDPIVDGLPKGWIPDPELVKAKNQELASLSSARLTVVAIVLALLFGSVFAAAFQQTIFGSYVGWQSRYFLACCLGVAVVIAGIGAVAVEKPKSPEEKVGNKVSP